MPKLPVVSGREVVKALAKVDYTLDRQSGSHIVLRQSASPLRRLTIPDHKEIARATLRAILRQAGLTVERVHRTVIDPERILRCQGHGRRLAEVTPRH